MISKENRMRLLADGCTDEQIKAFDRGDVSDLLSPFGNSSKPLVFTIKNVRMLKRRGIFEQALVLAWMTTETNHRNVPLCALEAAFRSTDRPKLRDQGDPLPEMAAFTIYRGVAGDGPARRVRGLSWTRTLPAACWFALRFHLNDPAIFVSWIHWYEVFWYKSGGEDELICKPKRAWRLAISVKEMRVMEREYLRSMQE